MPNSDTPCIPVEQSLVEHYLGCEIPSELVEETLPDAKRKLDRIISREGDADGERLKPYYLAQLISETVRAKRFSIHCYQMNEILKNTEKECACKADTPSYNNPILA